MFELHSFNTMFIYRKNFILSVLALFALFGALFFIISYLRLTEKTAGNFVAESTLANEDRKSFVEFANIKISVEIADTGVTRAEGLSGRKNLVENTGMLFLFNAPALYPFWMKDMKFPIDIIWFREGRVVGITARVYPEPGVMSQHLAIYMPQKKVDMALEVNAGFAEKYGIKEGSNAYIAVRGKDMNAPPTRSPSEAVPGSEFFIENMRMRERTGKDLKIERTLADVDAYTKYLISYLSDGIKISGIMNVPKESVPKKGFPVLILNHGLIGKDIYFPGRGSKREQDFFARNGYVVIHPDYRGLGESDADIATHHDFYTGYSLDAAHLVDAVKESKFEFIDAKRIGMWGHSMGGGIAARVMLLRSEIRAYVLFAPISADAEDNFYELSQEEVAWLHKTYGPSGSETYKKISSLNYFSDVLSPVQLHHGMSDRDVPILFSEKMYAVLQEHGKRVEYFVYPGAPHEFVEDWLLASQRALQFFDMYVKK